MDTCGKWKLINVEKMEEYCDAIGCAAEVKEKAVKLLMPENNILQEIYIDSNQVTITTQVPGKEVKVVTEIGKATDVNFLDGRKLKSIFTLEGNVLKEEQTGAFVSTNLRYVEGNNLIMKMTCGDVSTTRKYEKV